MPAKSKTYKKRPKAKPSQRRQRGEAAQARAMTQYIPFFRRINAPRQFTKLLVGYQGFVPASNVTGGYFDVLPTQFETPLLGNWRFSGAQNGVGQFTGSTGAAANYAGFVMLSGQYGAYRVHSRRLTVTLMPSLAGDQINFAIMPSTSTNPPAVNNFATYAGNTRGKSRMVAFGGEPGVLTYKHSVADVVGLTKLQWECQPPTRMAFTPAAQLFMADYVLWTTNDGGTIAGNICFVVKLEIDVELSEPITLSDNF